MKSIPLSRARLAEIFEHVEQSRQPVRLTSHNFSVIVLGSDEWTAIEETLYRLSAPRRAAARQPSPKGADHVR